jgi:hypothetical protein
VAFGLPSPGFPDLPDIFALKRGPSSVISKFDFTYRQVWRRHAVSKKQASGVHESGLDTYEYSSAPNEAPHKTTMSIC